MSGEYFVSAAQTSSLYCPFCSKRTDAVQSERESRDNASMWDLSECESVSVRAPAHKGTPIISLQCLQLISGQWNFCILNVAIAANGYEAIKMDANYTDEGWNFQELGRLE